MRILVYPHSMEVGGSQLNALDLAGAMRDRGHMVHVVSERGPLEQRVRELDLSWSPVDFERRRPSLTVARLLAKEIRLRGIDIVHAYEWPPILEAWAAAGLAGGVGVLGTVMSMGVAGFLPRPLPLTVGTEQIARSARRAGYRRVAVLEPPVDTVANSPAYGDEGAPVPFPDEPSVVTVVVVSRLVPELKLEGIEAAIDVVAELPAATHARLVIVGDGPARGRLEALAAQANARAGRSAVLLTGQLLDPRPAYAAADIVLGMGGSALRGLAFAKPVIVQGERGYWQTVTPESVADFYTQGWFGIGTGSDGRAALRDQLMPLIDDQRRRLVLGIFGRKVVEERFSLAAVAEHLEVLAGTADAVRRDVTATPALVAAGPIVAGRLLGYKLGRRYRRLRGSAATDDFNAVTR